jgi:hypothetical protein
VYLKYRLYHYIHFEINGVSCNLIGSQECDKSMVFPAIWLVHRSAISARFVLKSHLLSTNHIRVLTSANQSYLIIGFKQPINFTKKNVIWQMSKNKKITYVMNDLSNFLHMKANTYSRFAVMRFCNHAFDFSPNCTPLSSITLCIYIRCCGSQFPNLQLYLYTKFLITKFLYSRIWRQQIAYKNSVNEYIYRSDSVS